MSANLEKTIAGTVSSVGLGLATVTFSASNEWTRRTDQGLVLHPNQPGERPATAHLRFASRDATGFVTRLHPRSPECPPLILALAVIDGSTDEVVAFDRLELEAGQVRDWEVPFTLLSRPVGIRISCRNHPDAPDNSFSGLLLKDPRLCGS